MKTTFDKVTEVVIGFCGASSLLLMAALAAGWPKNRNKERQP